MFQAVRALQGPQVRACPRPQKEPSLQELSGSHAASTRRSEYFIVYSIRGINEIPTDHCIILFNVIEHQSVTSRWLDN